MSKKKENKFKVKGMDRKENINSKLSIYDSINIIFNSMIYNKGDMISIELLDNNNEISIQGVGKNCTRIYDCTSNDDLNENLLLQSLIYLASEVKVIASKDGEGKSKVINFETINNSYGTINDDEAYSVESDKEKMEFKIDKSKLSINGQAINDSKMRENISDFIRKIYRQTILNGLKVKMFSKEITAIDLDGRIVNKDDCIINEENDTRVYLYKMNSAKNDFEVLINDVFINIPFLKDYINWKKSPLRRDGYTYTNLYISLQLIREEFNLNDNERIKEVIELFINDIEDKIRNNSDEFLNEKVYISIKYERDKMNKIKNSINELHASSAVKKLLDDHYEVIKNDNKEPDN